MLWLLFVLIIVTLCYNGLPDQSLNRLQRIVNTAARILCRIPKFGHISETLMDLHWLPVQQRVLFKVLILTYQAYHKTTPSYLCDLITPYSNSCNLRSNNQLLLASCQPRTKLKTYGELRSFQYAAPNEWNNLPLIIRESPSLAIFKNKLKTFYFIQHIVLKYIFFLLMSTLIYFITTVMSYNSPIALLILV